MGLGNLPLDASHRVQQQQLLLQKMQQQAPLSGGPHDLLRLREQDRFQLQLEQEVLRRQFLQRNMVGTGGRVGGVARNTLNTPNSSLSLGRIQELLANQNSSTPSTAVLHRSLLGSSVGSDTQASLALGSRPGVADSFAAMAAPQQPGAAANSWLLAQLQQQMLSGADGGTALRQSLPDTNVGSMSLRNMSLHSSNAAQLRQASNSATLNSLSSLRASNPSAGAAASTLLGQAANMSLSPAGRVHGSGVIAAGRGLLHPAPATANAALPNYFAGAGAYQPRGLRELQQHSGSLLGARLTSPASPAPSTSRRGDSKTMDSMDEDEDDGHP